MTFHANIPKRNGTIESIFSIADVFHLRTYQDDCVLGAEVFTQGIYYFALTLRELPDGFAVGLYDLSNSRVVFDEFYYPLQFDLAHGVFLEYLSRYIPTRTANDFVFNAIVETAIANGDIQ